MSERVYLPMSSAYPHDSFYHSRDNNVLTNLYSVLKRDYFYRVDPDPVFAEIPAADFFDFIDAFHRLALSRYGFFSYAPVKDMYQKLTHVFLGKTREFAADVRRIYAQAFLTIYTNPRQACLRLRRIWDLYPDGTYRAELLEAAERIAARYSPNGTKYREYYFPNSKDSSDLEAISFNKISQFRAALKRQAGLLRNALAEGAGPDSVEKTTPGPYAPIDMQTDPVQAPASYRGETAIDTSDTSYLEHIALFAARGPQDQRLLRIDTARSLYLGLLELYLLESTLPLDLSVAWTPLVGMHCPIPPGPALNAEVNQARAWITPAAEAGNGMPWSRASESLPNVEFTTPTPPPEELSFLPASAGAQVLEELGEPPSGMQLDSIEIGPGAWGSGGVKKAVLHVYQPGFSRPCRQDNFSSPGLTKRLRRIIGEAPLSMAFARVEKLAAPLAGEGVPLLEIPAKMRELGLGDCLQATLFDALTDQVRFFRASCSFEPDLPRWEGDTSPRPHTPMVGVTIDPFQLEATFRQDPASTYAALPTFYVCYHNQKLRSLDPHTGRSQASLFRTHLYETLCQGDSTIAVFTGVARSGFYDYAFFAVEDPGRFMERIRTGLDTSQIRSGYWGLMQGAVPVCAPWNEALPLP